MKARRQEKFSQEIARLAGDFLAREAGRQSLITATRVGVSEDLRVVTIYLSILPVSAERAALKFAKRARSDFREYVKKHGSLSPLPTFDFEIDRGEKNRQRIEELMRK